jgi:MiaB-like tRNA modifying enzyme
MKVYIKTYGCTLNQADGDLMTSILEGNGIEISNSVEDSDVVVLNTCTVKKPTEQRTLHILKRLHDQGKRIVVSGCMPGSRADAIEKYAPNASMITTSNIQHIYDAVANANDGSRVVFDTPNRDDKLLFFNPGSNIIAKVPVNDGCLSICSFCETKHARGPLNSYSEQLILKAVESSVKRGAKEIQITSQDMGAYGADRKTNIAMLMKKISMIDGDFKVRIGMLNPEHLGKYLDLFIDAMQDRRFYRFVHLPVQSGSDRVLGHMKRRYTIEKFYEYAKALREQVQGIAIETDVIVGYPTESLSDFDATMEMIKEIRPDVTNVSKFCARPHSSASKLKSINNNELSRRSAGLSRLVRSVQKEINNGFVGRRISTLMTEVTGKSLNGRSPSYKQVVVPGAGPGIGEYVTTEIQAASANVLYGRMT